MRGRLAALALTLGLLLTGCAAGERASASEFAPEEGERLVVYTSHKEEVYWPIIQEFEARTGIWVEVEAGGTSELLARLRREADARPAECDVRRRRGQPGGISGLLLPLLLCRLGRGWTRPCARRRDCGLPSPPCRW